jgi:CRISP-associated protein Cas1
MDDDRPSVPPLVPARMLNEFAYCPRLAYLMWVQGEWEESADTEEGKVAHRNVDRERQRGEELHRRSLHLSSEELGLTAVIDLVEGKGERVRPVDYKRGKKPAVPGGAYEPERVQVCAQGLLLREHGFHCDEGLIYFVASKSKVRVPFSEALVARTLELLAEMRRRFEEERMPPPLEDSPKCPRCSLVRICMPEEVNFLRSAASGVRPLLVPDAGTHPLVVQEPRCQVRLDGGSLVVAAGGSVEARRPIGETSHLVLAGGAGCTRAVIRECCLRGVPIVHMSGSGWFYGITHGMIHKNVELRAHQFAVARDPVRSLGLARSLVTAKIRNCRVLLRRNGEVPRERLRLLHLYARHAEGAHSPEQLLGVEGNAARLYFSHFTSMLKGPEPLLAAFRLDDRNKRPPRDPINALLSFAYSLLTKDCAVALYSMGFDPLMGFYHQPRYGKPALALDLMEPFRPVIADSVVLTVVNNREVGEGDFIERVGGVLLKPAARRRVIAAYERRLAQEIRHPIFGYRATYRRILEIQARLLARYLLNDIAEYPALGVR